MAHSDRMQELVREWREEAGTLRPYGGESSVAALDACAADLEAALREVDDEVLTIAEAAEVSGYSVDHLGRLLREGVIPTAGEPHAPRICRKDLPRKLGHHPGAVTSGDAPLGSKVQMVRSVVETDASWTSPSAGGPLGPPCGSELDCADRPSGPQSNLRLSAIQG